MGEEIGGKLLRELGIKKLKIFFESCDSPTTALQAAATRDEKGPAAGESRGICLGGSNFILLIRQGLKIRLFEGFTTPRAATGTR